MVEFINIIMKRIFFVILIILSSQAKATRYYVSSSQGSNSNNGTSTATPWQTLTKVTSSMSLFVPGDTISFRKGDVFPDSLRITKSGTSLANIVFNSYGTGNSPLFSGIGSTINNLIYAINQSYILIDGIAITDPTFPSDPNRLILSRIQVAIGLDQCTHCTVQNCDISLVGTGIYTAQGGFHNINNNVIYNLRMIVNDTTKPFNDYGANNLTIDAPNNTITHNILYGGWAQSFDFTYDGGAIEFYDEGSGCSNNYIAYNTMYDNNGISETGGSGGIAICNNNVFVYNKLINNRDVFYFHGNHTGWQFYNNAVIETSNNRLSPTFIMSGDNGTSTQVDIKNNVFQIGIGGNVLAINLGRINATHTNNIYKLSGGTSLGFTLGTNEVSTSDAFWTNTSNVDPVLWNYTPLNPGLLIGTGTNVGLSTDFAGNPVSNPPDISLLQSVVPPTPPPTPTNKLITRSVFPPTDILTFTLDNFGATADFLVLNIYGTSIFKMTINWGDGSPLDIYNGNTSYSLIMPHTFPSQDTFNVSIQIDNISSVYIMEITSLFVPNPLLKRIDVRNLKNSSAFTLEYGNITTLNISNNKLLSSLDLSYQNLTTNSVNYILSTLAQNGINNGVLYLNNQTPPTPPTGQGLIDKATLQSRGWTVYTD